MFDALPQAVQYAEFLCEEAHELDGMAMELNGFRCPDCYGCRFNRENLLRAHRGQERVDLGEFLGAEEGADSVTAYITQQAPAIAAE